MFIQDTFAEARSHGLLDGFVGTYADLRELVNSAILAEDDTFASLIAAEKAGLA